jgi:hypothetical protein
MAHIRFSIHVDTEDVEQIRAIGFAFLIPNMSASRRSLVKSEPGAGTKHAIRKSARERTRAKNGPTPYFETTDNGTLCRERNCEWQRDEWENTRKNSVGWLSSD